MDLSRIKSSLAEFFKTSHLIRWFLFAIVMTIVAIIIYPNIIFTEQSYRVGDVVKKDIKAPKDFLIEDKAATIKKRQQAGDSVLTVYDHDTAILPRIKKNVTSAFAMLRKAMEETGKLSENTESSPAVGGLPAGEISKKIKKIPDPVWNKKKAFEKKLGIEVSDGAFSILIKEKFSPKIADLICRILGKILTNGVVANKEILLKETGRGIVLRKVGTKDEKKVQNLKKFYGLDQSKIMVRIIAQPLVKDLNYNLVNLIVDFSQRLIQPNITLNRSETEERKKQAAAAVSQVFYKIKAGEMLLREGERVTDVQLLKLKRLRSQNRAEKRYASCLGALLMLMFLLLTVFFLHVRQRQKRVLKTNKDVLFISVLLILFLFLPYLWEIILESLAKNTPFSLSEASVFLGVPLASGPMAVCLFMGFEMAVCFAVVISSCMAVIFQSRLEVFIYFFLNSLMAAYWMQNCRERKVFIKTGITVGFFNIIISTAVLLYTGDFSGLRLLWNWLLAFTGGIISGILTAGMTPLLEFSFGYTTDITLLELANLERPILRKLLMEAPGTYHHSVIVGSMVEAAAAEIGANPLLAKVCGYYHDIGKIKKPLYFIENQTGCENRHDKLAPSMSSLILISHVKEGVEIAKKHKLGSDIIDAIRQHHGTSIIHFFYHKAIKIKGEGAVKIENFRYPGPRPQTREIALVMLADVLEAASRSLENPTPARIQGLVQSLINKIFADGQLDNCELTLKDLHKIAKCFNKILTGIHHHRIEYPEKNSQKNTREKNGNTDNKQSAKSENCRTKAKENNPDHLRRLGVS